MSTAWIKSKLPKPVKKVLRTLISNVALAKLPPTEKLPLPDGYSEERLFELVNSVRIKDGPEEMMNSYCVTDFRRFVYTFGLARGIKGKALELGANPYFTSVLLREMTELDVTLANYFEPSWGKGAEQEVTFVDFKNGKKKTEVLKFDHFNVEMDEFPYAASTFDVVLFCEIIEHLQHDPVRVLKKIKTVLKPDGILVLTTPNVARLENVAKIIAGKNIYDPYSGHGPYGRHNREYNMEELKLLLQFLGFEIETIFTSDVHPNGSPEIYSIRKIAQHIENRKAELGQYIFIRARNARPATEGKPRFLYRSYSESELV